jgi:hypothetical protein
MVRSRVGELALPELSLVKGRVGGGLVVLVVGDETDP